MLNGISLGILIILILLLGGFVLTILIGVLLIPLFKTPKEVLDEIVDVMDLKKEDRLVDLGSGDGRILFRAHRVSGCNCTGYDISPIMLILAKTKRFLLFPLTKEILFEAEDLYKVDLNTFTKTYCYLEEKSMGILKEKFSKYIKGGGEIYSYRYDIPGLEGEKIILKNKVPLYIYR